MRYRAKHPWITRLFECKVHWSGSIPRPSGVTAVLAIKLCRLGKHFWKSSKALLSESTLCSVMRKAGNSWLINLRRVSRCQDRVSPPRNDRPLGPGPRLFVARVSTIADSAHP